MRLAALLLLLLAPMAASFNGVDMNDPASVSVIKCLISKGYHFFIGRIYRSNGQYDPTGAQNIKNAHAGGMEYVDAYLFPCLSSSCPSATSQVQSAVNRMRSEGVKIGMLWLDIERYAWPADQNHNRNFILQMASQGESMGVKLGIYTNNNNWQSIVGLGWTGVAKYPLWWANYNNKQDFLNFVAFGGWSRPNIHQYAGDYKGVCGVDVDLNWYPGSGTADFDDKFMAYRNGTVKSMLD